MIWAYKLKLQIVSCVLGEKAGDEWLMQQFHSYSVLVFRTFLTILRSERWSEVFCNYALISWFLRNPPRGLFCPLLAHASTEINLKSMPEEADARGGAGDRAQKRRCSLTFNMNRMLHFKNCDSAVLLLRGLRWKRCLASSQHLATSAVEVIS